MKKSLLYALIIPLFFVSLSVSGCGDSTEKIDPKQHEEVLTKLDEVKELQTNTDKEISKLRDEIRALEIEKQKLIAEKKRLEADIIDLKIKDQTRN